MREAIKRSSVVINGHQWSFVARLVRLPMREAIKRSSVVINGHQWSSVARLVRLPMPVIW
jgi:hypothetical protein